MADKARIQDAIGKLADDEFNADGKPSVTALEKQLDEDITADERDQAWEGMGRDRNGRDAGDDPAGDDPAPAAQVGDTSTAPASDADQTTDQGTTPEPSEPDETPPGAGAPAPEEASRPDETAPGTATDEGTTPPPEGTTTAGNPPGGEAAQTLAPQDEPNPADPSAQRLQSAPFTQSIEAQNPRTRQQDLYGGIRERQEARNGDENGNG